MSFFATVIFILILILLGILPALPLKSYKYMYGRIILGLILITILILIIFKKIPIFF